MYDRKFLQQPLVRIKVRAIEDKKFMRLMA